MAGGVFVSVIVVRDECISFRVLVRFPRSILFKLSAYIMMLLLAIRANI